MSGRPSEFYFSSVLGYRSLRGTITSSIAEIASLLKISEESIIFVIVLGIEIVVTTSLIESFPNDSFNL
jgi:hypothetical protein